MVRVTVRRGFTREEKAENFEFAMKLFKRNVNNDGVLREVKERSFYEKPGVVRRKAKEAAMRNIKKKQKKAMARYK